MGTREFRSKCVRGLAEFPTSACASAIKKIKSLPQNDFPNGDAIPHIAYDPKDYKDVKVCPWYIIDEDEHFCFFKWAANEVNQKEHTLEHMSILLGTSIKNVYNCLNSSLGKSANKLSDPTS